MKKLKKCFEQLYPLLLAILVAVLAYKKGFDLYSIPNPKEILAATVNISAISIGFLATMIAILIATVNRRVMRRIRDNKAMPLLNSYFYYAVISGFATAFLSTFLNIYIKPDGIQAPPFPIFGVKVASILWIFVVAFFAASSYRIINILMKILSSMSEDDKVEEVGSDRVIPEGEKAFNKNAGT